MDNFKMFFEDTRDQILTYYNALDNYLRKHYNWFVEPIEDSPYGQYAIRNVETGDPVGKIERHLRRGVFYLDHIGAAFEEDGVTRKTGTGLVNIIYPFEKQFVIDNNIQYIESDLVNSYTQRKFKEVYGEYPIVRGGNTGYKGTTRIEMFD